jgi:hypothetical protein
MGILHKNEAVEENEKSRPRGAGTALNVEKRRFVPFGTNIYFCTMWNAKPAISSFM